MEESLNPLVAVLNWECRHPDVRDGAGVAGRGE